MRPFHTLASTTATGYTLVGEGDMTMEGIPPIPVGVTGPMVMWLAGGG